MSHDRAHEKVQVNKIIEYEEKKKEKALTSSSSDKNVF